MERRVGMFVDKIPFGCDIQVQFCCEIPFGILTKAIPKFKFFCHESFFRGFLNVFFATGRDEEVLRRRPS